jgi:hypothetical protein
MPRKPKPKPAQNSGTVRPMPKGVPFKAGTDPRRNTGGRPREEREVVEAIRARGLEVVEKLFELGLDGGNVFALKELMDRGYGKAKQVVEVGGTGGGPIRHRLDFSKLTIEQRKELLSLVVTARALPAGT